MDQMNYGYLTDTTQPDSTVWTKVTLERPASRSMTDEGKWCDDHKSNGRYYRKHEPILEYAQTVGIRTTYWYFENKEDATLFALTW